MRDDGLRIINDALTHVAATSEDSIEYAQAQTTLLAIQDLHANDNIREGLTALYPYPSVRKYHERQYVQQAMLAKELE